MFKKVISFLVLSTFLSVSVIPAEAQSIFQPQSVFSHPGMATPYPGSSLLDLSESYQPSLLSGIKIFPKEPFRFDFLMAEGDSNLSSSGLTRGSSLDPRLHGDDNMEAMKLIKYFLASLTVPEGDLWVNLSPHEPDRIISDALGQTQMGHDLLAQDYILKKLTASLMHPDGETGKKFWEKIYQSVIASEAKQSTNGLLQTEISEIQNNVYGSPRRLTTPRDDVFDQLPDMFNKIWIVPDQVEVYQNNDVAYITNAKLKVMTESEYVAEVKSQDLSFPRRRESTGHNARYDQNMDPRLHGDDNNQQPVTSNSAKEIIKDIIIPVIEHEVNHGEHFAPLRQIFHSMILAKWYESHFKNSLIGQKYVDRNKISGLSFPRRRESTGHNGRYDQNMDPRVKPEDDNGIDQIYQSYLDLFKTGVTDVIREEYDPVEQKLVTRKYFSGGFQAKFDQAQMMPPRQALNIHGFDLKGLTTVSTVFGFDSSGNNHLGNLISNLLILILIKINDFDFAALGEKTVKIKKVSGKPAGFVFWPEHDKKTLIISSSGKEQGDKKFEIRVGRNEEKTIVEGQVEYQNEVSTFKLSGENRQTIYRKDDLTVHALKIHDGGFLFLIRSKNEDFTINNVIFTNYDQYDDYVLKIIEEGAWLNLIKTKNQLESFFLKKGQSSLAFLYFIGWYVSFLIGSYGFFNQINSLSWIFFPISALLFLWSGFANSSADFFKKNMLDRQQKLNIIQALEYDIEVQKIERIFSVLIKNNSTFQSLYPQLNMQSSLDQKIDSVEQYFQTLTWETLKHVDIKEDHRWKIKKFIESYYAEQINSEEFVSKLSNPEAHTVVIENGKEIIGVVISREIYELNFVSFDDVFANSDFVFLVNPKLKNEELIVFLIEMLSREAQSIKQFHDDIIHSKMQNWISIIQDFLIAFDQENQNKELEELLGFANPLLEKKAIDLNLDIDLRQLNEGQGDISQAMLNDPSSQDQSVSFLSLFKFQRSIKILSFLMISVIAIVGIVYFQTPILAWLSTLAQSFDAVIHHPQFQVSLLLQLLSGAIYVLGDVFFQKFYDSENEDKTNYVRMGYIGVVSFVMVHFTYLFLGMFFPRWLQTVLYLGFFGIVNDFIMYASNQMMQGRKVIFNDFKTAFKENFWLIYLIWIPAIVVNIYFIPLTYSALFNAVIMLIYSQINSALYRGESLPARYMLRHIHRKVRRNIYRQRDKKTKPFLKSLRYHQLKMLNQQDVKVIKAWLDGTIENFLRNEKFTEKFLRDNFHHFIQIKKFNGFSYDSINIKLEMIIQAFMFFKRLGDVSEWIKGMDVIDRSGQSFPYELLEAVVLDNEHDLLRAWMFFVDMIRIVDQQKGRFNFGASQSHFMEFLAQFLSQKNKFELRNYQNRFYESGEATDKGLALLYANALEIQGRAQDDLMNYFNQFGLGKMIEIHELYAKSFYRLRIKEHKFYKVLWLIELERFKGQNFSVDEISEMQLSHSSKKDYYNDVKDRANKLWVFFHEEDTFWQNISLLELEFLVSLSDVYFKNLFIQKNIYAGDDRTETFFQEYWFLLMGLKNRNDFDEMALYQFIREKYHLINNKRHLNGLLSRRFDHKIGDDTLRKAFKSLENQTSQAILPSTNESESRVEALESNNFKLEPKSSFENDGAMIVKSLKIENDFLDEFSMFVKEYSDFSDSAQLDLSGFSDWQGLKKYLRKYYNSPKYPLSFEQKFGGDVIEWAVQQLLEQSQSPVYLSFVPKMLADFETVKQKKLVFNVGFFSSIYFFLDVLAYALSDTPFNKGWDEDFFDLKLEAGQALLKRDFEQKDWKSVLFQLRKMEKDFDDIGSLEESLREKIEIFQSDSLSKKSIRYFLRQNFSKIKIDELIQKAADLGVPDFFAQEYALSDEEINEFLESGEKVVPILKGLKISPLILHYLFTESKRKKTMDVFRFDFGLKFSTSEKSRPRFERLYRDEDLPYLKQLWMYLTGEDSNVVNGLAQAFHEKKQKELNMINDVSDLQDPSLDRIILQGMKSRFYSVRQATRDLILKVFRSELNGKNSDNLEDRRRTFYDYLQGYGLWSQKLNFESFKNNWSTREPSHKRVNFPDWSYEQFLKDLEEVQLDLDWAELNIVSKKVSHLEIEVIFKIAANQDMMFFDQKSIQERFKDIRRTLRRDQKTQFSRVLYDSEKLIGFLIAHKTTEEVYLNDKEFENIWVYQLWVDENYRGQRLAVKMLNELALHKNIFTISLATKKTNENARNFYRRLGFTEGRDNPQSDSIEYVIVAQKLKMTTANILKKNDDAQLKEQNVFRDDGSSHLESSDVGGIDLNDLNIEADGAMMDMNIDSRLHGNDSLEPAMMDVQMNTSTSLSDQIQIPFLTPRILSISKFETHEQLADFLNLDYPTDPAESDHTNRDQLAIVREF